MERLRTLRSVVLICIVLLFAELGLLVWLVRPATFYVWSAFGVIALLCVYLARISLMMIRERQEQEKQNR